jgi:GTP-binding protein
VNFFRVGDEMYLTDLPGYGFARVSEAMRRGWERLVTSYLVDREAIALGVFIVDARHEPMEGDERLKAWLEHEGLPYLVVAAKADKIGKGEVARRVAALRRWADRARDVVAVSARDGRGIDALWRGIRDSAEDWRSRGRRA